MKYIKKYEKIGKKYSIGDYVFIDFGFGDTLIGRILNWGYDWDYYILLPDRESDDEINEDVIKRRANETEIEIFNIKKGDLFLINYNETKIVMTFKYLEQEEGLELHEFIYYFEYQNKEYGIYLKDIIRKANETEIDSVIYNL